LALIAMTPVQRELKLTEAQKTKLMKTRDEFNRRRQESRPLLAQGPEAQGVNREVLQSWIAMVRAEHLAAVNRILDSGQRARLEQIALQLEGPLALTRPEIAGRINLNPDQVEQIQGLVAQMSASRDQYMDLQLTRFENNTGTGGRAPGPGARAGSQKPAVSNEQELDSLLERIDQNSTAMQKNAIRAIGRVLTRRQKAAFNKLLGEPFDTSTLGQGGGKGSSAGWV
jgi:hypothetical protein